MAGPGQNQAASGTRLPRAQLLALVAALLIVPMVIYLPGMHSKFHLDDWPIALKSKYIRISDLSRQSLTAAAFQDFGNNRPLPNLSLALNFYFNRKDPFGYHLVNLTVFIITAFGVWLLLRKLMLRLGRDEPRATLAAWAAALLWSCHPVNVQAVTYVVQRYASMAGMFTVWSIYFFHLGLERPKGRMKFLALSAGSCLAAMLCKETAATLPGLLFLYKVFFFDELKPGWLRKNRAWVLGLAVIYLLAAAVALRPSMAHVVFNFSRQPFGALERTLAEPKVLLWYPGLIIFPFPQFLSLFHAFHFSDPLPVSLIYLALVLVVLASGVLYARKSRALSFAVFWYFGQLLVEAMPLPIELAHEHRLYLASLSLLAPAAAWPFFSTRKPWTALAAVIPVALFFSIFTTERNKVFRTDASLWRDTLSKAPDFSSMPWRLYCLIRLKDDNCLSAEPICKKAMQLASDYTPVANNLGDCYSKNGKWGLARQQFLQALEHDPQNPGVILNVAQTYLAEEDWQTACNWLEKTLRLKPDDPKALYQLAQARNSLGDQQAYLDGLARVLQLRPGLSQARMELVTAYAKKGECEKAEKFARKAILDDPRIQEAAASCMSAPKAR